MKLSHLNVGLGHLSRIETGEEPTNIEDMLLDAQLFRVDMVDDYYEQIIYFLETGTIPEELTVNQKNGLVVKEAYFQLIVGQLYKPRPDEIL